MNGAEDYPMAFRVWLVGTFLMGMYCLVRWIRTPQSEAGKQGYQDDRDWWIVSTFASMFWPVFVVVVVWIKGFKLFERLVLAVFGPLPAPEASLNEKMRELCTPVPDTLLEKFQEMERVEMQRTCPHTFGNVMTIGEGVHRCARCHADIEYMWTGVKA